MSYPQSLNELIANTKAAIASGELSAEQTIEGEAWLKTAEELSVEEHESTDYFLRHMPPQDSELSLIVLKGHLLLEQKIREFVCERMLSPSALDKAKLSFFQVVCLAEALTLPNEDPKRLWGVLLKVNSLRNQLAHNLEPVGIEARVKEIIIDYSPMCSVRSGFPGVLASAYGQLSELCRIVREPQFRMPGRDGGS